MFAGQLEGTPEFETLADVSVLKGAVAQISCNVVSSHTEGDHTLFIGEVKDIHLTEKNPLLFFCGKYRTLSELSPVN